MAKKLYKYIEQTSKRIIQNERLYSHIRCGFLYAQYKLHILNEPDFQVLSVLNTKKHGLIVDIGANGGQSAISFSSICPTYRIESFEPNPALITELNFTKWLLGNRFRSHPYGLGKQKHQLTLYIPVLGKLPLSARASVYRDIVEKQLVALTNQLGKQLTIKEIHIDIMRFDDLDLHPDAAKIDVEGNELPVLEGMKKTIQRTNLVFILEKNRDTLNCQNFLREYGYEFYYFNTETSTLCLDTQHNSHNWFAIPKARINEFSKFLQ